MTPQIKARIEKHLNSSINYNGNIILVGNYYKYLIDCGYTKLEKHEYSDGVISYRLENGNGSLYEIPKMIYDNFYELNII